MSLPDRNLVKHPKIKDCNSMWLANGRKDLAVYRSLDKAHFGKFFPSDIAQDCN